MSGYSVGRRIEHIVVHHLTEHGYDCTRAASSKGSADVIALRPGQVLLVSVKRTNPLLPPAERKALLRIASHLPDHALALVAYKPERQPLRYRRLTGQEPRAWVEWEPGDAA